MGPTTVSVYGVCFLRIIEMQVSDTIVEKLLCRHINL